MAEEVNRPDISFEGEVATWLIKAEGAILGTYAGTFKFRAYLTPSQMVAANTEMRDMLGENAILSSKEDQTYALALTQLKHRVLSAPPFWDAYRDVNGYSGDIPDKEVLVTICNAAIDAEAKFKQSLEKKKKEIVEKAKKAAEAILQQQRIDNEDKDEKDSDKP